MAERESLTGGKVLLDGGPLGDNGSIGEKTHDDSATLAGLLDGEESLAGHPSVGHSLVIGLAFALTYNHIEAIVAKVEALAGTLHTIAYYCDSLILESFESLAERIFLTGDDGLFSTAEIEFCHNKNGEITNVFRLLIY